MGPTRWHLRVLTTTAVAVLAPLTSLAAADPSVPVTFTPNPVDAGNPVSTQVDAPGIDPRDFQCTITFDKTDLTPACTPVKDISVSVTFTVPDTTATGPHDVTLVVNKTMFVGSVDVTAPPVDVGTVVPDVRLAPRARAIASVTHAGLEWCPTGKDSGFVLRQDPPPETRGPSAHLRQGHSRRQRRRPERRGHAPRPRTQPPVHGVPDARRARRRRDGRHSGPACRGGRATRRLRHRHVRGRAATADAASTATAHGTAHVRT